MRADRLLSMVLLLQSRGRMTASDLAEELAVSERTIYRDIEALSLAGIPVYAERGPGGGCALVESYRTSLTGLKEDEVQALFSLGVPRPLAQLGIGPELKTAMLKVAAALPGSQRGNEEQVRQRIQLDPSPWSHEARTLPYLQVLHQAVWHDQMVRLKYRWFDRAVVERTVEPYGLVAKSDEWYLVAYQGDFWRVYRVAELAEASLCEQHFTRQAGFNLEKFWQRYCRGEEQARSAYTVRLRVAPGLVEELPHLFGQEVGIEEGRQEEGGWRQMRLSFESFYAARDRLLAFGGAVEVLKPEALRKSMEDYAKQVLNVYQGSVNEGKRQ